MTSTRRPARRAITALLSALATITLAATIAPTAAAVPRDHGAAVVAKALPGEATREVTGKVAFAEGDVSATLTAPRDRQTFATEDSLIAVLERGQSTATFGMPGYAEVQEDGGLIMGTGIRGIAVTVEKPWAKDANGTPLKTWYEVDGTTLVQHVDTEGAAFPIAADPKFTFGAGVYLNVWGAEVKMFASIIVGAGGGAYLATCRSLDKIPSNIRPFIKALCNLIKPAPIAELLNTIVKLWKSGKVKTSWCYQKRIVGPATGWYDVPAKNCM